MKLIYPSINLPTNRYVILSDEDPTFAFWENRQNRKISIPQRFTSIQYTLHTPHTTHYTLHTTHYTPPHGERVHSE